MNQSDGLVKLLTGGTVIINRLKTELELRGIKTLIKDRFKQGVEAGFVDGQPSGIEIFVTAYDFKEAIEIVEVITGSNKV